MPWSDLVPELAAPTVDARRGFAPSRFRNVWIGKWFYWREYPACSFSIERMALEKQIDRDAKHIQSITGQLDWNYTEGVVTIKSPMTLGVCGFLSKRDVTRMQGIAIASENEFGTIVVTSLDGQPLSASRKFLIQAMTEEKPYGWQVKGDRIVNLGGYPMNVREVNAIVHLKRPRVKSVTVLDEHGYARGKIKPERVDDGIRIRLPKDAIYTIVEMP